MSARCPHCGGDLAAPASAAPASAVPAPAATSLDERYDLEALAGLAERERAYDESVKVRVTQEDIRKLVEKRRRKK